MGAIREIAGEGVGEGVPHAGDEEDGAHRSRRDAEHVGRELHQIGARQHEHEADSGGRGRIDEQCREGDAGPCNGVLRILGTGGRARGADLGPHGLQRCLGHAGSLLQPPLERSARTFVFLLEQMS